MVQPSESLLEDILGSLLVGILYSLPKERFPLIQAGGKIYTQDVLLSLFSGPILFENAPDRPRQHLSNAGCLVVLEAGEAHRF